MSDVIQRLRDAANTFVHCGDYCNLYWNPTTETAWLCMGDGDGDPDHPDIMGRPASWEAALRAAGAKHYRLEAEYGPPTEDEPSDYDDPEDIPEDERGYISISGVTGIVPPITWQ